MLDMICLVLMRKVKHSKYIRTKSKRGTKASRLETKNFISLGHTAVMVDANFLTPSYMLDCRQVTGSYYSRYE